MKTSLERTVEFGDDRDDLHSVYCDDLGVSIRKWVDEKRSENAISMDWRIWDALVAEVEHYRKLKAQSEAA